jgi:hypothetical protein
MHKLTRPRSARVVACTTLVRHQYAVVPTCHSQVIAQFDTYTCTMAGVPATLAAGVAGGAVAVNKLAITSTHLASDVVRPYLPAPTDVAATCDLVVVLQCNTDWEVVGHV